MTVSDARIERVAARADAAATAPARPPDVTGDVLVCAYCLAVLLPPSGPVAAIIVGVHRPGQGLGVLFVSIVASIIWTLVLFGVALS